MENRQEAPPVHYGEHQSCSHGPEAGIEPVTPMRISCALTTLLIVLTGQPGNNTDS
ncbi:hypothetical protein DPMN_194336 [Dreissena polymorpha]|uniref:Uncharacterized protein n=1 Tax=Dreissena polymorpha TaxID=45954 RepID=A0A9D4BF72_DREPO|nr:hypothetical protein DPMN_194336 [Dreissena polymorpha]